MDDQSEAPNTLGEYLHRARERARLSLRNLEEITGVSRPTLNRLENDQIDRPNPAVLHKLAEALELNSDDLFSFIGITPSKNLPSLAPYLRAKYQLPPHALAEANRRMQEILEKYDHEAENEN